MLNTYNTLKNILGEAEAKKIIKILVNDLHFYISFEEIQKIKIFL